MDINEMVMKSLVSNRDPSLTGLSSEDWVSNRDSLLTGLQREGLGRLHPKCFCTDLASSAGRGQNRPPRGRGSSGQSLSTCLGCGSPSSQVMQ